MITRSKSRPKQFGFVSDFPRTLLLVVKHHSPGPGSGRCLPEQRIIQSSNQHGLTGSNPFTTRHRSIGSYHSEFASPSGGHANAMEDGGDWQAVTMTPARRRSPVVMSSSKRVRAPPAGLQELLEDCGSDEEEEGHGGRHVKPFGEWAKGRGLGMDELAGADEGWT